MRLTLAVKLLLAFFVGSISACANPMAGIKKEIKRFKEEQPGNFHTYISGGVQMRFAFTGDPKNPPLIFVHGSPGEWGAWVNFLTSKDLQKRFHLVAIDRPGYGGSGEGKSVRSLKEQARLAASVLQFNQSGKPALLVGHSYGGAVIAQMAVDFPALVSALVFVASSVDPVMEETKWYQHPAQWWPIRILIPDDLRVCNEEILALKEGLEQLRPRWKMVKAKVATIQGTADKLVPKENQDFILRQVPKAQIKLKKRVNGMNHFVPWEHPELILEAISAVD